MRQLKDPVLVYMYSFKMINNSHLDRTGSCTITKLIQKKLHYLKKKKYYKYKAKFASAIVDSKSQHVCTDSMSYDMVLSTQNVKLPVSSIVGWHIGCL